MSNVVQVLNLVSPDSILEPFLFKLYVNDLLSVPCNSLFGLYSKIFLVIVLNKDPLSIARRCCTNSLVINPDKSKLLVIKLESRRLREAYHLFRRLNYWTSVAKDMEIVIESSLQYNQHVTKTVSDISIVCIDKRSYYDLLPY